MDAKLKEALRKGEEKKKRDHENAIKTQNDNVISYIDTTLARLDLRKVQNEMIKAARDGEFHTILFHVPLCRSKLFHKLHWEFRAIYNYNNQQSICPLNNIINTKKDAIQDLIREKL